jgi:hypothetical protein
MKELLLVIIPLIFGLSHSPADGSKTDGNSHVNFEASLVSTKIKPGAKGQIVVYLTPAKGIHINTNPEMQFDFQKIDHVHFLGITTMPKQKKTGYLDSARPVRYTFAVDKTMEKGTYTLKGTVQYFLCSDVEGWCNRFTQPIELTFSVAK